MASLTFVDMTTESPTKPLMALGKIPSVDIIKEHLGLNAAPVKVKNEFRDMTVEWRKKSIMSNSRPATDLVDWHSPAVQKDLYTLAETFLADKENAERFWSASRPWKYDSELQYPDDKKRIIELLVQLFFKQNRYYRTNQAYGLWAQKDPESESSREGSTPKRMASIDATSGKDTDKSSRKRPRSETVETTLSSTSNFIDLSASSGGSPTLPWDSTLPPSKDIYDVPDEQEPVHKQRSSGQSSFPSKHDQAEQGGVTSPVNIKAGHRLRGRKYPRVSNFTSDAEFDELLKEMEKDSDCLEQDHRQNTQRAPVARMMTHMDLGSSENQQTRRVGSADYSPSSQKLPVNTSTQAKKSSGSLQMLPPSRASKKTPSPQQKPSKSNKITLKIAKRSSSVSGTSKNTHRTSGSTTNSISSNVDGVSGCKTSPLSSSSDPASEATSLHTEVPQINAQARTADASKHPAPSTSQPTLRPNDWQQNAPFRIANVEDDTSEETPHSFAPTPTTTKNNLPTSQPGISSISTTQAAPGENTMPQVPTPDIPSKQPPKPLVMKFFIITREPRDTKIFWPEGKIQGTSLSDFIAGVAKATRRNCIEKLDLTLKTAISDTEVPVAKDDEDSWLFAKREFTERLKAARTQAKLRGLNEDVNPEIYVEPFYGQVGNVEDAEEEDEDEEISYF